MAPKSKIVVYILALAAWLLCAQSTCADVAQAPHAVLHLDDASRVFDLGDRAELLVDETEALTLAQVQSSAQFEPVGAPRRTVRLRKGVLWLRLTVQDDVARPQEETQQWRIDFSHPRPVQLTAWLPDPTGTLAEQRGGLQTPLEERAVVGRSVIVPFFLPRGVPKTLYFRLATRPLGFSATIATPDGSARTLAHEEWVLGLYYGIALGLFLYNLFLLIALRDTTYAWYVAFLGMSVLFFLSRNGYLYQWGWHRGGGSGGGAAVMLQLIGLVNFARRLLGTRDALPRTDRLLGWTTIASLVVLILALLFPQGLDEARLSPLALPILVVTIGVGVVRLWQGSVLARYYVAGWMCFLSGAVLYILKATATLPHNWVTEHTMQLGSAAEMVLLSLALAHRIRDIERIAKERELAVERARIDHQRHLAELRAETATRILEAQEEHSRLLARDLHDSVGHRFLIIAQTAQPPLGQAEDDALDAVAALAREGLAETREIAHGMYPQRLHDLGLCGALQAAADAVAKTGLTIHVDVHEDAVTQLTPKRRLATLRVAEEAMQNVLRHAGAKTMWVHLSLLPQQSSVRLRIEDDGAGVDPTRPDGLGARSMQDRADQVGARLTTAPRQASGTIVMLDLPLQNR